MPDIEKDDFELKLSKKVTAFQVPYMDDVTFKKIFKKFIPLPFEQKGIKNDRF